eukprot:SAG31_NODE_1570_length_7854_cov_2.292328_3_plen_1467_part_00
MPAGLLGPLAAAVGCAAGLPRGCVRAQFAVCARLLHQCRCRRHLVMQPTTWRHHARLSYKWAAGRSRIAGLSQVAAAAGRQPQPKTGAEVLVKTLISSGITDVFGIPGTHTVPIYNALEEHRDQISHTLTRHEQGAGFAAEGYARASGRMAAVCTITGVGVTNTLTPMASAMADSVPMLVISSEVPAMWQAMPSRQYSHQVRNLSELVHGNFAKASFTIQDPSEVAAVTARAIAAATSGRPGPVYLSIGIDKLKSRAEQRVTVGAGDSAGATQLSPTDLKCVKDAASRISRCLNPIIIVGGACQDESELVTSIADTLGAPVLTTVAGKGVVDERHPLSVGTRMHLDVVQKELIENADGILLLGTQVSPTDFWQFKHDEEVPIRLNENTIHVNIDENNLKEVGASAAGGLSLQMDIRVACTSLVKELRHVQQGDASGTLDRWNGDAEGKVLRTVAMADCAENMTANLMFNFLGGSGGEQMNHSLAVLRGALEDVPLVADVCRIGYTALSKYQAHAPREFIYPVGSTALGFGLPAAIGAAIAKPHKCVALIVGDGGFQFTMPELIVAVEQQLPILILLWNDESYGEIRRSLPSGFGTKLSSLPNFSVISAAFGIPHHTINDSAELSTLLGNRDVERCLGGEGGPVMIELRREWDSQPTTDTEAEHRPPSMRTGAQCLSSVSPPIAPSGSALRRSSTLGAACETVSVSRTGRRSVSTYSGPPADRPGVVLGTMTFGWAQASTPVDGATALQMLDTFTLWGGTEVDTARMYAGGNGECIVADAVRGLPTERQRAVKLATKANPADASGEAGVNGGYRHPLLLQQAADSFHALQTDLETPIDLFYLHWPDQDVAIEEALTQVQCLHDQGRFERFGLSNFSAEEVQKIFSFMEQRGWVKPSVYQGLYNAVTRGVEPELFPILRENQMSFYAYNPLAGGILTGKHDFASLGASKGRFKDNEFYIERYGKSEIFEALAALSDACKAADISMVDASLRWMMHHSEMNGACGDKLIVGCSSVSQLEQNLASTLDSDKLPDTLVSAFDDIWSATSGAAASYAQYGMSGSSIGTSVTDAVQKQVEAPATSTIINRAVVRDEGKQVELEFNDGSTWHFRSSWLRDASPTLSNASYTRADAYDVLNAAGAHITAVSIDDNDKAQLSVTFTGDIILKYRGDWLRAFSPYVALSSTTKTEPFGSARCLKTSFLVDEMHAKERNLWQADHLCVQIDADDLIGTESSIDQKVLAVETMCRDGVLVVRNLERPASLELSEVGEPLKAVANAIAGKLYQHPRRHTNHGIMRKKMAVKDTKSLADYNLDKPLAMHTDHGFISDGVAGCWQLLHQVNGSAKAKVCNAAAVAAELERIDPEAYRLLCDVHITHALRTIHYDVDGDYMSHSDEDHPGVFEDESTHPVLKVDSNCSGERYLAKVSHQEIKRGVCAVPYQLQDAYFAAYRKFMSLTEDERFVAYVGEAWLSS